MRSSKKNTPYLTRSSTKNRRIDDHTRHSKKNKRSYPARMSTKDKTICNEGETTGLPIPVHGDGLNEDRFGDLESLSYPERPKTMLTDCILANSFEETFGDVYGEGVWSELNKTVAINIHENIVALASFNGEKKFFACTGCFIEWNGCTTILTSASLIRDSYCAHEIFKNLRIEVKLRGKEQAAGILQHYNLHYNIALVRVNNYCPSHPVKIQHMWLDNREVLAVGRIFESDKLMASRGHKASMVCKHDCGYLHFSKCRITKAGIGGALLDFDGKFVGMNFYDKRAGGTWYLTWEEILHVLGHFEKKRTVDEAGHDDYASNKLDWTIDGDHSVRINRWFVPLPFWCHPDAPKSSPPPRRLRSPPRRPPPPRRYSCSPPRRPLRSRSRSISPRRVRGPPLKHGRSDSSYSRSPTPPPRKGPRRVSRSRSPRRPPRGRSISGDSRSSSSPSPRLAVSISSDSRSISIHGDGHNEDRSAYLESLGYPERPKTMLTDCILANSFEEPFGDTYDKGVWSELNKTVATNIHENIVALASFNGEKRFFACTGCFIEWNGCTTILTSASLIRDSYCAHEIFKNLRIEVKLPGKEQAAGILQHYNLHYNIALVRVNDYCPSHPVKIQHRWRDNREVLAVGRIFKSGKLMASRGRKASMVCKHDCGYLRFSKCRITKAGIGGPLLDFDGKFVGMNFYDKRAGGTWYLTWEEILHVLGHFEKKRTVDEAGHDDYASNKLDWTIAGDHSVRINRWFVPLPFWCRPDALKRYGPMPIKSLTRDIELIGGSWKM